MTKLEQQYYNFFMNLYNYKKRIVLQEVDFDKPWWVIIWKQRLVFSVLLVSIGLASLFDSWIILLFAKAIEKLDSNMLAWIVGLRILVSLIFVVVFNWNPIFQLRTVNSVFVSANKRILTTDPIFHTTRSSGVIISKISKGSSAFESFLDIITFEMFGLLIGSIATIVLFFGYNFKLGLICGVAFVLIAILSVAVNVWNNKVFKPICIEAEDQVSQATFETLSQASFVRSVFGSDNQIKNFESKVMDFVSKEATSWETNGSGFVYVRILFFLFVGVVGTFVIEEVRLGNITMPIGIALVTSFVLVSKDVQSIGSQVKRFTQSKSRIVDLFEYIRGFGKQTYPVMEEDVILVDSK